MYRVITGFRVVLPASMALAVLVNASAAAVHVLVVFGPSFNPSAFEARDAVVALAADPQGNPTEVFCSRFAASFLVPLDALLREEALKQSACPEDLRDEDVQHMAARFCVSRYVIWRRILEAGGLSEGAYWERVNRWKAAPPVRGRIKRALPHAEHCLRQRGPKFASLVLEAKGRNLITYRDLIDYIGLNPKDIGSLESRLRGDRGK